MACKSCSRVRKIGFAKKIFNTLNAVAHGVRPKKYTCRFMMPGLTNYPGDSGKDETWLISRPVMDAMQESFIGCPVVEYRKHNEGSTPENFEEVAVGVVSDVWTDPKDGWDYCSFIVWDGETQKEIDEEGFNVSCAYNTLSFTDGGDHNAIPYAHEVTEGEYIHMAIVPQPRQSGAKIMTNSMDPVFMFNSQWSGKEAGFKFYPQGRMNALDDEALKEFLRVQIDDKRPLNEIIDHLKSEGNTEERIQAALGSILTEGKIFRANDAAYEEIKKIADKAERTRKALEVGLRRWVQDLKTPGIDKEIEAGVRRSIEEEVRKLDLDKDLVFASSITDPDDDGLTLEETNELRRMVIDAVPIDEAIAKFPGKEELARKHWIEFHNEGLDQRSGLHIEKPDAIIFSFETEGKMNNYKLWPKGKMNAKKNDLHDRIFDKLTDDEKKEFAALPDDKKSAYLSGKAEKLNVAPEGWEETVKGMKKHPEIDNPWALAWWMKDQGMKGNEDTKEAWKKFKAV